MSASRITVRIEQELQKRLETIAQASGKTESEVVRAALGDYLARERTMPTCFDLFKKTGAIGCVKGGPTDVSTHPKHMRGFGRE